ncbi:MAG: sulfotransferase [Verrucomicrobiota bacterium]|nr:sulfotransferase [Verrucomicrobiota bacterium]
MPATLPFDQRACFVAGQAKSGTTLLVALLDSHPQLLVLPEETAYFPTVLAKFGRSSRRTQFDYLTRDSLSNVVFGGPCKWGKRDYSYFPTAEFLSRFEKTAFAPANAHKDLLVIMLECYAAVVGRPLDSIARWVEKTPANRRFLPQIRARFPQTKILLTMRDPRAILAAQIALEKTRQLRRFSVYYCISHWREAATIALQAMKTNDLQALVVLYEQLVLETAESMRKICEFLEIEFDPATVLTPTKAGKFWEGNSAAETQFTQISRDPLTRWENELKDDEIGWVEWHCRDLMPAFGYAPRLARRRWRHWLRPIPGETPREYLKSRLYSLRDALKPRAAL